MEREGNSFTTIITTTELVHSLFFIIVVVFVQRATVMAAVVYIYIDMLSCVFVEAAMKSKSFSLSL